MDVVKTALMLHILFSYSDTECFSQDLESAYQN
jgi:hypothetical protein